MRNNVMYNGSGAYDPTAGEAVTKVEKQEKRKKNSRQKGARGERELAKKLKEYGYDCRRGQQYSGIEGQDIVGLPRVHVEVKRVEKLNIYDAIDQAKRDSKANDMPYGYDLPAVFHRKNNCEWLVTMTLKDWIIIYREFEMGMRE